MILSFQGPCNNTTQSKNSQDWILRDALKYFILICLQFKCQYSYYDFKYYKAISEPKDTGKQLFTE